MRAANSNLPSDRSQPAGLQAHAVPGPPRPSSRPAAARSPGPAGIDAGRAIMMVRANEIRRKAGDIGGLELSQSRVERDRFGVEVKSARAACRAAMQKLSARRSACAWRRPSATRRWHATSRQYDPGTDSGALIARAMEARDEVRIARATLDNARDNAGVARANRWVDPGVGFTLTVTPGVRGSMNEEGEPAGDGTPRSRMVGVSVSIPLPLSRLQRGELIQAESAVTQAMLGLREAELKTEVDVRNAFTTFQAARENLQRYRDSVIADADRVLEGMRQSYRHGSASLLELLDAQRPRTETYLDYLQAQADLAAATCGTATLHRPEAGTLIALGSPNATHGTGIAACHA
ncbi:TolC family protein [Cupriavidus basilensis]